MQSQQPDDQKNLMLAVVLSLAVLLVWQLFFSPPPPQPDPAQDAAVTSGAGGVPAVPGAPAVGNQAGGPQAARGVLLAGG